MRPKGWVRGLPVGVLARPRRMRSESSRRSGTRRSASRGRAGSASRARIIAGVILYRSLECKTCWRIGEPRNLFGVPKLHEFEPAGRLDSRDGPAPADDRVRGLRAAYRMGRVCSFRDGGVPNLQDFEPAGRVDSRDGPASAGDRLRRLSGAYRKGRALALSAQLASPTFENSNRLVGWIREMGLLRHAIGRTA